MEIWFGILVGAAAVYSWKLLGSLVPKRLLEHPRVAASANYLTISLMAALIGVQTFTSDVGPVLDARFAAVVIAVLLAIVRAPFLVIVLTAAAVAALLRLWF